ncbi:MAG: SulP family sulfate permease [Saprospiraceae bacterium]|jgi:SulP family sulfate permease
MSAKFGFNFSHIKGDLMGGITAGIVALPLSLAFGVSSGLGPSAGLYGAIFVSFFAALFGGTNTQISGPTAPMTAVSMVVIAGIIATTEGDISKALPVILAVFLLAGLFQIGLGLLGLGQYIRYIPYPVVSGFMTAIGVIILVTQILPAIGYYPKEDTALVSSYTDQAKELIIHGMVNDEAAKGTLYVTALQSTIAKAESVHADQILTEAKTLTGANTSGVIGTIKILPRALQFINWLELLLALLTIVIIYGFKKITTKIPSTLVALLVVSGAALLLKLDYKTIQEIPSGLPIPNLTIITDFNYATFVPYIFTALTLAILGSIDSLLTSVVADNMTKTKHNPNQELIGQGIGNSIASVFGGLPGAGATIRTIVNIKAGGKTKISGMIAGIMLLVILVALGPAASKIPAAVLAGILITVGIGVMDYKGLKATPHMPKSEVIIMLVVLVLSATWNLVYAVGIGLIIASLMFMKKIGDLTENKSSIKNFEEEPWDDEKNLNKIKLKDVFIKHINGPLFFGSTSKFQQLMSQLPPNATTVIIRMKEMNYMDQTGLYAMEEVLITLAETGRKIIFTGVQEQPRYMMERVDIIPDLIPRDQIFSEFDHAIESLGIK